MPLTGPLTLIQQFFGYPVLFSNFQSSRVRQYRIRGIFYTRIQTCEECSQNRDSPYCVQVFQILLTETARLTVIGNSTLLAYILFCVLVKFQRVSIVVEFLLGPRHN